MPIQWRFLSLYGREPFHHRSRKALNVQWCNSKLVIAFLFRQIVYAKVHYWRKSDGFAKETVAQCSNAMQKLRSVVDNCARNCVFYCCIRRILNSHFFDVKIKYVSLVLHNKYLVQFVDILWVRVLRKGDTFETLSACDYFFSDYIKPSNYLWKKTITNTYIFHFWKV